MRRADRHGRLTLPDTDRRRRPSAGFRLRQPGSFDRVVADALADLVPAVGRVCAGAPVDVVDVPAGQAADLVRLVSVAVVDGGLRRLTIHRRAAEQRATSRDELVDVLRDAIELEVAEALGLDPDADW